MSNEPQGNEKKHPGGRPSKFDDKVIGKIKILTRRGFTDLEICTVLDICEKTFYNWKRDNEEFLQAVKVGKSIANERVERALYERALGYSHPDVHITNYQGEITETDIIKHYPPDPTSIIFFLCNRDNKNWKRRRQIELVPPEESAKQIHDILKAMDSGAPNDEES